MYALAGLQQSARSMTRERIRAREGRRARYPKFLLRASEDVRVMRVGLVHAREISLHVCGAVTSVKCPILPDVRC
jgi:hypothetical protein